MRTVFTIMVLISLFSSISCKQEKTTSPGEEKRYFTNPVVSDGADPWVIRQDEYYYYCFSKDNKIWVSRSARLEEIGKAAPVEVWQAVAGTNYSAELWAPELHYLNGRWYIYVAGDNGDNKNHRMYVLEGSSVNPQDKFTMKGKIASPTDKWAIDGTVFTHNDKMYFIWSGWEGDVNIKQNLYIAPMSNPWTISGERVLISSPELPWEKRGGEPLINEGPEILQKMGHTFIIYSASGSWSDYYCLGQLKLTGTDPLKKSSWEKHPSAVFSSTDKVFAPGHASFVKSPDGTEDWIVYHAAKKKGAGWDRNVRIQKFGWKPDHSPDFGRPVDEGVRLEAPSGK